MRRTPAHLPSTTLIHLPANIIRFHDKVMLCIDFFFVNGNPFFHSISRDIGFWTVRPTTGRGKQTIIHALTKITDLYKACCLAVTNVHGDNEFECVRTSIMPLHLHVTAPGDHVPKVERLIRTVKDRVRSTIQGLPYDKYPKMRRHSGNRAK